jgi:hypothetical protein
LIIRFTFFVILETVLAAEDFVCFGGFCGRVATGGSAMLGTVVGSGACVVTTTEAEAEAEAEAVAFEFEKKSAIEE